MNFIEFVKDTDDNLCAIIIRAGAKSEMINFITDEKMEFQIGLMKRDKNNPVLKHKHNLINRNIQKTSEVIIVRKGSLFASVWSNKNVFISSAQINYGDIILFYSGYHGITFEEECEILEIKQGPYSSNLDKSYS
jgi:hypothetical protein